MRTEVSDATLNDGIATVAAETCTSVPRQCVAGGGPARFDFPGGGLRASGDVRLRLQSVARAAARRRTCATSTSTRRTCRRPPPPPPPPPTAASRTARSRSTLGARRATRRAGDPRFAADWRLTLHYVLEDA